MSGWHTWIVACTPTVMDCLGISTQQRLPTGSPSTSKACEGQALLGWEYDMLFEEISDVRRG